MSKVGISVWGYYKWGGGREVGNEPKFVFETPGMSTLRLIRLIKPDSRFFLIL